MANLIKITQFQAPQFRALIKAESDGTLFNPSTDLATQAELDTEGINDYPISCTVYKSLDPVAPYIFNTARAEVVEGFENVEIPSTAFIDTTGQQDPSYNFAYTFANRKTFAFQEAGVFFVDFMLYPKTGAALAWRTGVEVV